MPRYKKRRSEVEDAQQGHGMQVLDAVAYS